MRFKEKVQRHLAERLAEKDRIEQQERQEAKERYRKEEEAQLPEREAKLKFAQENIPPLVEALKSLPIIQLLTEIKNDEWKCGEVEVLPGEITWETPVEAAVKLSHIVENRYIERHLEYVHSESGATEWKGGYWFTRGESIEIGAEWSEDKRVLLNAKVWESNWGRQSPYPEFPSLHADDPGAASAIEKWLMEVVIERRERENPPPFRKWFKNLLD